MGIPEKIKLLVKDSELQTGLNEITGSYRVKAMHREARHTEIIKI